jgi:hypothetical protein
VASRKIALKKTPDVYKAIEYQRTDAFNLLILARRLFEFGEAHFRSLTLPLRDAWSELPAIKESKPHRQFPISIDDERAKEILTFSEKAMRGMQVMNGFKARLGPLWPDKDAVGLEQYDDGKSALRQLKDELLRNYGKLDAERAELERLWPFDD